MGSQEGGSKDREAEERGGKASWAREASCPRIVFVLPFSGWPSGAGRGVGKLGPIITSYLKRSVSFYISKKQISETMSIDGVVRIHRENAVAMGLSQIDRR